MDSRPARFGNKDPLILSTPGSSGLRRADSRGQAGFSALRCGFPLGAQPQPWMGPVGKPVQRPCTVPGVAKTGPLTFLGVLIKH